MRRPVFALLLLLTAGSAVPACAQVGYGELERYYSPGAYVPYGGANFQTRYNYYPAMIETGFGYGRDFRHYEIMDRIDREERAARFAGARLLPFERMGPIFGRGDSPVLFGRRREAPSTQVYVMQEDGTLQPYVPGPHQQVPGQQPFAPGPQPQTPVPQPVPAPSLPPLPPAEGDAPPPLPAVPKPVDLPPPPAQPLTAPALLHLGIRSWTI